MADLRRIAPVVAALAVSGCGSGSAQAPPERLSAAEREVADGYVKAMRAFASGRYVEFCGALTEDSLKVTSRNVMDVPMSCPEWAEENREILGDDVRDQAEHLKIRSVEIDRDEALLEWSADVGDNAYGGAVEAERSGGRWRYTAVTPGS